MKIKLMNKFIKKELRNIKNAQNLFIQFLNGKKYNNAAKI